MTKVIAIIVAVIVVFPLAVGFSLRDRASKIGLGLVILGFASIFLARSMYGHLLFPLVGEVAEKNAMTRGHLLSLMEIGFWVIGIGAALLLIRSTIRTWSLRKELFPFLFPPQ
jgi:glucan phosphoethanolaminetransferase (alkaline phosphatase superfamily)